MVLNKKNVVLSVCCLFLVNAFVAQNKYWIKFTNKTGTPYSIANPSAFLTAKSIARRATFNVPVTASDLPVNPSYVAQIENVPNVSVLYASKWMNGVVASITNTAALTAINSLSFVSSSNKVNRYKLDLGVGEVTPVPTQYSQEKTSANPSLNYGPSLTQAQQLNVTCLHAGGYRGQGMTIAVLDNGFNNANNNPVFDSIRARNGIKGTYDFVNGEVNVYNDGSHGALVFSTMAGFASGNLIGTAPYANYWLLTTEEDAAETISEEYNWIRGAEFADSVGADILTTSLGYFGFDNNLNNHVTNDLNGKIAPMSIAATMAARKGLLVLNSAGNSGGSSPTTIGVPADADSIISVGAVNGSGVRAGFSSIGPTIDGRIKPDLAARGEGAIVCLTDGSFGAANGTSFSCPILAGAVACFWQKNPTLKNMKVIDTLKKMSNQATNPDNLLGWGVPVLCSIVGVKEQALQSVQYNISVSPNPSNGFYYLQMPYEINGLNTITIYNLYGGSILQLTTTGNQLSVPINLLSQANGMYLVRVTNAMGSSALKLIKN
jgi:serine protease AprX